MQRVTITPYRDGPLVVRGAVSLLDDQGREVDAGRNTIALCRCGRSKLRPFCDGSHARTTFRAEAGLSREAAKRHPVVDPPPAPLR
jgi:CDGSH-type Zn-finger protein